MLTLPFRRSEPATLSAAVRTYIDSKYGQHPDMFRHDLEAIDRLRHDAIHVQEPHNSGIRKLMAYAAQLVWIGGKFPIDIGTQFTWYPALAYSSKRPVSRDNLKFELLNILWNLAALLTQLADGCPSTTTDGLKAAASYLSQAAGVLTHMQKEVLPALRTADPPDDMDESTLESLVKLCLAQCQECFWQKAVMDGYKDAIISRLAARLCELYADAAHVAAQSRAISTAWIHFMAAKHNHFAAAAQYRMARDCLEKSRYGEEIARLKHALVYVADGLREAKSAQPNQAVVNDLTNLKRRLEQDLTRAEKDNNLIYLDPVPAKSDLAILERANMAVPVVPAQVSAPLDHMGDGASLGPLLFAKLVPFAVHAAVSVYEQRRDTLVNESIVMQLEALNAKMRNFLRELDLPASLQALEKPLGIPNSIRNQAEEMRQANAVASVERQFRDIDNLRADNIRQFEQGKALLQAEADEDGRLRTKYGTDRWTRPTGRDDDIGRELHAKADEIEGLLVHSGSSDTTVRSAFDASFDLLTLLGGPDRGLLDFIPSSRTVNIPDTLKSAMGQLRRAYNDVQRLESRRRKKLESVEDRRRRDDVKPEILKEAARLERAHANAELRASDFEEFFNQRLDRTYDDILDGLGKEGPEQDKLLAEVKRANREFEEQRRRAGSTGGESRERAIRKLEDAFSTYNEVRQNLGSARTFYNSLLKVTGIGFVSRITAWVDKRHAECRALEEEINTLVLSQQLSQQLSHKLSLGRQHNTPPQHTMPFPEHQAQTIPSLRPLQTLPEPPRATFHSQSPLPGMLSRPMSTSQALPAPPNQNQPVQSGQGWGGQVPNTSTTTWMPDMGIRFAAPAPRPA